jgi:hypothetical protein
MPTNPKETTTLTTRRKRTTPPPKSRLELANEFAALPLDGLATGAQTAAYLNCSEAKLERDRWAGGGIPYYKHGRSVRYRKSVVLAYLEDKARNSTTD